MKDDKEERLKRIEQRITFDGSGKVIFIPQCNDCKFNISRVTCEMFGEIPERYRQDKQKCPEKVERK